MNRNSALVFILLFSVQALVSCSSAHKSRTNGAGILGQLTAEPVLNEETVERLKEIAESPNARLAEETFVSSESGTGEESREPLAPEDFAESGPDPAAEPGPSTADATAHLVRKWQKNGFNPRAIAVGDIFADHAGPVLNKAASLADRLNEEDWTRTIRSVAEQRGHRVPITLSLSEMNGLRERAPLGTEFPTRSVALDFRTITKSAKKPELEKLFEMIQNKPEGLTIADAKVLRKLSAELGEVKTRLEKGEQLYVITGVTRSDEMKATYPGAPVGSRDAVLIRNAVTALYPHLDNLRAEKGEESVTITREPGIYWEFEVRELKLEDDKLVIDEQSLAQR